MEWLSNLISYGLAAAGVVFFTVNSYQSSELGVSSSQLNKNNSELLCLDRSYCKTSSAVVTFKFQEESLLSRRCTSSKDSLTATARTESSMLEILLAPGMGTMQGDLVRNHASTI